MAGRLVLVLGDQLDRGSAAFDGFDRGRDRVWMAEVAEESTHVWTHKARIAVFLAAMRHFRDALDREGIEVEYTRLGIRPTAGEPQSLAEALQASLARAAVEGRPPEQLVVVEPGEWRVQEALRGVAEAAGIPSRSVPTGISCARATSSPRTPAAGRSCGWSTSTGSCGRASAC